MKLLISLLSVLAFTTAHGEDSFTLQYPIDCGLTKNLENNLSIEYGEEIFVYDEVFNEEGEPLVHSLWLNPVTGSWTFVITNRSRDVSCVMATGDSLELNYSAKGDPT